MNRADAHDPGRAAATEPAETSPESEPPLSDQARRLRRLGRRRVVSLPPTHLPRHDSAPDEVMQTRDDTDRGWSASSDGEPDYDAWLRAQRPPHWQ